MRIDASYASPAQGLYQAQELQSRSAAALAQTEQANSEQALMDLRRSELQAQTSTQAIKGSDGSDGMIGTVIDMMV
jgi:hypothetical protein